MGLEIRLMMSALAFSRMPIFISICGMVPSGIGPSSTSVRSDSLSLKGWTPMVTLWRAARRNSRLAVLASSRRAAAFS